MDFVDCKHMSHLANASSLTTKGVTRKKEFLPPKTRHCSRPVLESIESVYIDRNVDNCKNAEFKNFNNVLPICEAEQYPETNLAIPCKDDKSWSSSSTDSNTNQCFSDSHFSDIPGPSHLCNAMDSSNGLLSENVAPKMNGRMPDINFFNTNGWSSKRNVLVSEPLPKHLNYQLKNKRQRHVYHTIKFLNEATSEPQDSQVSNSYTKRKTPPPLPYKPHYLRGDYKGNITPPLPPRIINKEAMIQRRQLNEEYFENIRCNVDGDFLDVLSDVPQCSDTASSLDTIPQSSLFMNSGQLHDSDVSNHMKPMDGSTTLLNSNKDNYSKCKSKTSQKCLPEIGNCSGYTSSVNLKSVRSNLLHSLKVLQQCGWYWGNMTWQDAETMLNQRPGEVGLFLVRDSQDPLHILTVSVQTAENTVRHIRIEHSEGKFQLYDPDRNMNRRAADCVRHPDIVTFIKLVMKHSRTGNFLYFVRPKNMGEPPVQIQLLHPVSRFSCVKSLCHYTRFLIRGVVPIECVPQLSLPPKLKEYLMKSRYFDPDEDLKCALLS